MTTRYLVKFVRQTGVSLASHPAAYWNNNQPIYGVSDEAFDFGSPFQWPLSSLPQTKTDASWATTGATLATVCGSSRFGSGGAGLAAGELGGGGFDWFEANRDDFTAAFALVNTFALGAWRSTPRWWRLFQFFHGQTAWMGPERFVGCPATNPTPEPAPVVLVGTCDTATSGFRGTGQPRTYPDITDITPLPGGDSGTGTKPAADAARGVQTATVVYSTTADAASVTWASTSASAYVSLANAWSAWVSAYARGIGLYNDPASLAYYAANVAPAAAAYVNAALNYTVLSTKAALTYLNGVLP